MSNTLKDLIRHVRMCQTAADEKALIQKECSAIRSDFREGKEQRRARHIMKLMYIHMLGYATEFGQVECVKLLAHTDYTSKRVGYLTLGILLDENQEVLTLIQNHLKRDVMNGNQFIQSLALATIANVAGEDIARDICRDVGQQMQSPNSYIKKKAILAGLRIVRKVPEYAEYYTEYIISALTDRNNGVMMSALTYAIEIMHINPLIMEKELILLIPSLSRSLKNLLMSSYTTEHDVGGIADPFVQVRILKLFSLLAARDYTVALNINDLLAQVATNTDSSKNVGCSILYECARAILTTESDTGLTPVGVNILVRFLGTTDNNYRYVALNSMLDVSRRKLDTLHRHRSTIIECLKDCDPSIRKRALDLVVSFVSSDNVQLLVPDLITYLGVCTLDFRSSLVNNLFDVINKYAPTLAWKVEYILNVIITGGSFAADNIIFQYVQLVTQCTPDVRKCVTKRLWNHLKEVLDVNILLNEALLAVGVWVLGEYCEDIISGGDSAEIVASKIFEICSLTKFMSIKQSCLTAVAKIAARIDCRLLVLEGLKGYLTSADVELQQRAKEYCVLLSDYENVARRVLDKVPVQPEAQSINILKSKAQAESQAIADIDHIFGTSETSSSISSLRFEAHTSEWIKVTASAARKDILTLDAELTIFSLKSTLTNISIQVAVPKSATVSLDPISSNKVESDKPAKQTLVVRSSTNEEIKCLSLKVRVHFYTIDGVEKEEMFTIKQPI